MEIKVICSNCKKEFVYKGGEKHYLRSKKHYCSHKCLMESKKIYSELHNKSNKRYQIWCSIKKRAKLKGLDFNLTLDDIPQIPKKCPVLGIPIIENKGSRQPTDIKGNIRIISNRANRIKADATIEELRKVLEDYEKIYSENRRS